jgi:hypothetical protein
LAALNFRDPEFEGLRALDDSGWRELFSLCDSSHLTLALRTICRDNGPEWARSRIERNVAENTLRFNRIKNEYSEIAAALAKIGADHLVLKGFGHWPGSGPNPRLRMQSDIDLFCLSSSLPDALRLLKSLGYEADPKSVHSPSTQHLPTMVRTNKYEWKGNFFDPELPLSVDLHFRFWNAESEGFGPDGLDQFWVRRIYARLDEIQFPTLNPVDALGYASLHALRHILLTSLLTNHLYELAWFLHSHAGNTQFWRAWITFHGDSLRRLEAICFSLAATWFDCDLAPEAREEIDKLPQHSKKWVAEYGFSPLEAHFRCNKDALWLHYGLITTAKAKRRVLRERLLGTRIPSVEAFVEGDAKTSSVQVERQITLSVRFRHLAYVCGRIIYHVHSLPEALWRGMNWWRSSKVIS